MSLRSGRARKPGAAQGSVCSVNAPDTGRDGQPLLDDDFLVLVNAWWEHIEFTIGDCREGQAWVKEVDSYDPASAVAAPGGADGADAEDAPRWRAGGRVTVGPRSVVVLRGPRAERAAG